MKDRVRLASTLQMDSIVDGEGIRTVIWFQGCPHKCPSCHNPESHALDAGFEVNLVDLLSEIGELEYQDGITLSGGEPMLQPHAVCEIASLVKTLGMSVWCWSGFTFEELLGIAKHNPVYIECLKNIDVLVDGKFEIAKKSLSCKFRGSTNQRILDVQKSLKKGSAVLMKKYN